MSNYREDGAGKDEETRKIVRKAAMRAFRRNQRLERAKKFMQEQEEDGEQHDPQPFDDSSENSPCVAVSASSEAVDQPESLVLGHNKDAVGSTVDASSSLTLFQPEGLSHYPLPSEFRWPEEITSLDPFGSSPLGTCSTWHHLFIHCESLPLPCFRAQPAAVPRQILAAVR